jgi:hypothetical protein
MESEEVTAQSSIIEQIKRFCDVLHWGEIRPEQFARMKKLTVPELEGLLQELKNSNSNVYVSRSIKAYLKRHEVTAQDSQSDSIHSD